MHSLTNHFYFPFILVLGYSSVIQYLTFICLISFDVHLYLPVSYNKSRWHETPVQCRIHQIWCSYGQREKWSLLILTQWAWNGEWYMYNSHTSLSQPLNTWVTHLSWGCRAVQNIFSLHLTKLPPEMSIMYNRPHCLSWGSVMVCAHSPIYA